MSQTKIFVVEDEALIANDLAGRLQDDGYDIVGISSSGEDALEKLGGVKADLVLMDIRLDGKLDGIQTAQKVRSDFGLPVVFLTAHADSETLRRAKGSEPFGYLVKPFRQISLTTSIEMAVHKHSLDKNLKQRLGWLTHLLHSSPDATIMTDTEGTVQFMNAAATALLGCSPLEWKGREFHEMVPLYEPMSGRAADDFLGRALTERTSFTLPSGLCLQDRNGREIMIEGEVAAGLFWQHEAVGAIITLRDTSRPRQCALNWREWMCSRSTLWADARRALVIFVAVWAGRVQSSYLSKTRLRTNP